MELRMERGGDERGRNERDRDRGRTVDISGGGASGLSFEEVQDGGYHEGYWRSVLLLHLHSKH